MYRILKSNLSQNDVEISGTEDIFPVFDFAIEEKKKKKAEKVEEEKKEEPPIEQIMLQEMMQKAEGLLKRAEEEAEEIRKEAYKEAYEEGFQQGLEEGHVKGQEQAYQEKQESIKSEIHQLQEKIGSYVADMEIQKEKILEKYLDDLKNISLAIGEKIVQTSLKSSSDVIRRMILAATEKLKKTAWAKIYVTLTNEEMDIQGDVELLKELAKLSDNVKIVVMEDAEPGTCIIELPHEIIDISTSSQMENIRDILNDARV